MAGVIVRVLAIRTLGRFFTANVATAGNQPLVAVGLYQKIRHPSYLGSLVCFLGMGVALGRWVSLAVSLCPITAAFIFRIHVEEKALIRRFGDSYLSYSRRTYRLLPPIF
jgi:protein-S-isoprenylcysteine O-methyltransferase Ste14